MTGNNAKSPPKVPCNIHKPPSNLYLVFSNSKNNLLPTIAYPLNISPSLESYMTEAAYNG